MTQPAFFGALWHRFFALGCSDNAAIAIASALTSKEGK